MARARGDASTPALLALLAALSALGAGPLVLAAAVAAWTALVLPALPRAGPWRVVESLVVSAPFLLAAARASAAPVPLPFALLALAVAVGLAATAAPPAVRRAVVLAAACAVGLPLAAHAVGAATRPPWASLSSRVRTATVPDVPVPEAWTEPAGEERRRVGALARTPGAPRPDAALWTPVPPGARAGVPAGRPAVLVVGARSLGSEDEGVAHLVWGSLPEHALDLDPFDVVLWVPGAPATGLEEPGAAEVAASFARRGGLLVGPAPPSEWPAALVRRVGPLGDEAGARSARSYGAGRVARAASREDLEALLAAGSHVPRVATAFDRALSPPAASGDWEAPPEAPARGPALGVLAVFAAAAAAATMLAGWRRAAAVVGLAALASVGVGSLVSPAGSPALEAFRIEVGGAGGRRVEGLRVTAGRAGWIQPEGGGVVGARDGLRLLGFRRVADEPGRLALPPGAHGWIVEESVGSDPASGLEAVRRVPSWARDLLAWRGLDPADARMRSGRAGYGGPRLSGMAAPVSARTLSVVP